jgi:hypothetical protein
MAMPVISVLIMVGAIVGLGRRAGQADVGLRDGGLDPRRAIEDRF